MTSLIDKVKGLESSLASAAIPHAFGGALALAYWTEDPRGTSDIDLNIFMEAELSAEALAALPDQVERPEGTTERIARDGQVRLWWGDSPVDLFFDYVPIHYRAAKNSARVNFAGTEIPILGPVELVVFKAMFDRTKDWADIEAMLQAESVAVEEVQEELRMLVGQDDQRLARLDEAVARAKRTTS